VLRGRCSACRAPIGARYPLVELATALLFFVLAGVLALVIRMQLALPGGTVVSASTYNQLFTMHGSVMMFLFAVPVVEAVAVWLLPNMLGARDLPFPRLSAYAFWAYAFGGIAFLLVHGVAKVPVAIFAAMVGYALPGMALRRIINTRKKSITNGLPDALDLFIVCLEAGSALDQAINRLYADPLTQAMAEAWTGG